MNIPRPHLLILLLSIAIGLLLLGKAIYVKANDLYTHFTVSQGDRMPERR